MKSIKNQGGMVVGEAVLIVIAILAISFVGWRVYSANQSSSKQLKQSASNSDTVAKSEAVVSAPQIKSTSDLDKAEQALNQLDDDTANNQDVSQLASQTAAF